MEPAYRTYVTPVIRDGKVLGYAPKQNPHLTQADFYSGALDELSQAAGLRPSIAIFAGR